MRNNALTLLPSMQAIFLVPAVILINIALEYLFWIEHKIFPIFYFLCGNISLQSSQLKAESKW